MQVGREVRKHAHKRLATAAVERNPTSGTETAKGDLRCCNSWAGRYVASTGILRINLT